MLALENCEKVIISSIARSVRISHSTNCTLFACVNTKPILHACKNIILAPYNSYYRCIEQDLEKACIYPRLNNFDSPLEVQKKNTSTTGFSIMPVEMFYSYTVPFDQHEANEDKLCPCVVPRQYALSFEQRMEDTAKLFQKIKNVNNTKPDVGIEIQHHIAKLFSVS